MKHPLFKQLRIRLLTSALMTLPGFATAQTGLLFDGDFESGTFQGWTPGGENGGFASVAAKGSCFSGNDTIAISFNGDPTSNYAALLRSNAGGETGSIATLRSQPFEAGNGVIFSALTETLSDDPRDHPVDFIARIIDSDGQVISEQPYRTAIVRLAKGCPSEKRDTAFSGHFIDTHHLAGQQISIEFRQNTRRQGRGFFTLIDNVVFIEQGQNLLSTSQPRAVAGTGITDSGTFFLDPRSSTDPDDAPIELEYSWFINGDSSIRELDIPCVNLNTDFQLDAGNNIATLYVNDGFSYSADTIRFVIPENTTGTSNNGTGGGTDAGTDDGTDTNTDTGTDADTGTNIDINTDDGTDNNTTGQGTVTLTDPLNECDVDLRAVFQEPADDDGIDSDNGGSPATPVIPTPGTDGNTRPVISVTANAAFTIGDAPIALVTAADIMDSDAGDTILSATITITNAQDGDALSITAVPGTISDSITTSGGQGTLTASFSSTTASIEDFETAIANLRFQYVVPAGEDPELADRDVTYAVSDGMDSNVPLATSTITVSP